MTDINITDEQFYDLIREECAAIADILITKNKQYGNSILRSPNVFSKTTPLDKIADRLDDKLSRVMSGREDDPEDAKLDIAGYLILERAVHAAMNATGGREVVQKVNMARPKIEIPSMSIDTEALAEAVGEAIVEEVAKAAPKKRRTRAKKSEKVEEPMVIEEVAPEADIADSLAGELAGLVEASTDAKTTEADLTEVPADDLLGESEDTSSGEGLMGLL